MCMKEFCIGFSIENWDMGWRSAVWYCLVGWVVVCLASEARWLEALHIVVYLMFERHTKLLCTCSYW
jgi:hypothetical protein